MNNWSIDSKIVQYYLHLLSVIDHPVYSNFWATLSRSLLRLLRVRPKVHTLRWGRWVLQEKDPFPSLVTIPAYPFPMSPSSHSLHTLSEQTTNPVLIPSLSHSKYIPKESIPLRKCYPTPTPIYPIPMYG